MFHGGGGWRFSWVCCFGLFSFSGSVGRLVAWVCFLSGLSLWVALDLVEFLWSCLFGGSVRFDSILLARWLVILIWRWRVMWLVLFG